MFGASPGSVHLSGKVNLKTDESKQTLVSLIAHKICDCNICTVYFIRFIVIANMSINVI